MRAGKSTWINEISSRLDDWTIWIRTGKRLKNFSSTFVYEHSCFVYFLTYIASCFRIFFFRYNFFEISLFLRLKIILFFVTKQNKHNFKWKIIIVFYSRKEMFVYPCFNPSPLCLHAQFVFCQMPVSRIRRPGSVTLLRIRTLKSCLELNMS